jgi:hypothetical protein
MDRYVSALGRAVYYNCDKMLYEITLPVGSRYQEGFDGLVAWQLHPRNGPAISEGDVRSRRCLRRKPANGNTVHLGGTGLLACPCQFREPWY